MSSKKLVAVAMSGGIDSAVSALLLKQKGYQCIGVFMKNWDAGDESESHTTCTIDKDRNDMRQVCHRLDIPTVEVEFIKEYWHDVFAPMLDSYKTGTQTPNPDVACNRTVKFHHFRKYVFDNLQVNYMATGHYARIVQPQQRREPDGSDMPVLQRGIDACKDQSYFLSMTGGENFRNVLFPIGGYLKIQVKEIAQQHFQGLDVLSKAESMGLCFVGKRNLSSFLGGYLTLTPGKFIDWDTGEDVGAHSGRELFTVGQGARIAGVVGNGERYFVTFAERPGRARNNGDVYVVKGASHPLLFSSSCSLSSRDFSWICGHLPALDWSREKFGFKSRYNQAIEPCTVSIVQSNSVGDGYMVTVQFFTPQRAITPGQILALYHEDACLGGGIIP